MDQLRSTLLAKVGPLPAYAWALIILGAYLAYSYFTHTGFFGTHASTAADSTGGGLAAGYGDPFPGGGLPTGANGSSATVGDNALNPTPDPYTGYSASSYSPALVDLSGGGSSPQVPTGSTTLGTPVAASSSYSSPVASGVGAVGSYLQSSVSRLVAALPTISAAQPTLGPATVSKSGRSL